MIEVPDNAICENCREHKATILWIGEGSTLDWVHGAGVPWCECCCLKAQLDYAKKRMAGIPELERKLAGVHCEKHKEHADADA